MIAWARHVFEPGPFAGQRVEGVHPRHRPFRAEPAGVDQLVVPGSRSARRTRTRHVDTGGEAVAERIVDRGRAADRERVFPLAEAAGVDDLAANGGRAHVVEAVEARGKLRDLGPAVRRRVVSVLAAVSAGGEVEPAAQCGVGDLLARCRRGRELPPGRFRAEGDRDGDRPGEEEDGHGLDRERTEPGHSIGNLRSRPRGL